MKQGLLFTLLLSCGNAGTFAFSVPSVLHPARQATHLSAAVEMGVVAVISAAAGALSRQPQVNQLEGKVDSAENALNETRTEMEGKLTEFEDKLYTMDQEYEAQTTKFKKQYEKKMKQEMERAQEKAKVDYQYKLEINMEHQKSKMLSQQYQDVSEQSDREALLSQLRMEMETMKNANKKLKEDLENTAQELEDIKGDSSKGKKFMGLFS